MPEDYKKITLSGKVCIKYIDDDEDIAIGDIRLFLNDDSVTTFPGDYNNSSYARYFKGEVFDGKFWQLLNLDEFLENREYKFAKKQIPLDTAHLCAELLAKEVRGEEIFRTYRGHFTRDEYVQQVRVTKANRNRGK